MARYSVLISGLLTAAWAVFFSLSAHALAPDSRFVRTANYFLKAGTDIKPAQFERLASYDLLILPMEAAVYNKDFFSYARGHNPRIVILAYVPSRSINLQDINDGAGIRKKMLSGIDQKWYLRDPLGTVIRAWPNTIPLNIASGWSTYLPQFVKTNVLVTGLWDGIFYDEVDAGISFLNEGHIDLNIDGTPESKKDLDNTWRESMAAMLAYSRELFGQNSVIVINGSSVPEYQPYVNGRMFESFPTPWEKMGRWEDSMASYVSLSANSSFPPAFIINANTGNSGRNDVFQKMRYSLASALLGNGFFGFDFGTQNHGQLWWYDEYDVYLGKPSTAPYSPSYGESISMRPGIWRRDFQNGTVVVNSSNILETVVLDGDFEKIRGTQDSQINDGSIVSSVEIPPSDGIILLRPLSTIATAAYQNGSFARVFDGKGHVKRNGFFAYDPELRGSVMVLEPAAQGPVKRIMADRGIITVSDSNGRQHSFRPFESWNGGLNIGYDETALPSPLIYVSKEYDAEEITKKHALKIPPSAIVAFDNTGIAKTSFYPLGISYAGSLRFALGDLNADGSKELVVGTGPGTEPIIRIYNSRGKLLSGGFLAYQRSFRGGVYVAIADIRGDRHAAIITAPGSTGSPHVRMFDAKARPLNPGFYAFSSAHKGGLRVAGVDIDGDGKDEIIATTTKVFTYAARNY